MSLNEEDVGLPNAMEDDQGRIWVDPRGQVVLSDVSLGVAATKAAFEPGTTSSGTVGATAQEEAKVESSTSMRDDSGVAADWCPSQCDGGILTSAQ